MNDKIYKLFPSTIIEITCILTFYFSISFKCVSQSESISKMLYIFSHANIFHLLLNLIALFQFRPRFKTCFIAYIASVLAAFIPFAHLSAPTCGLSGFLMACYARRYYSYKLSPKWLILSNVVLAFVPYVNWRIHLISFFIAYIIYGTIHRYTIYRRSEKNNS